MWQERAGKWICVGLGAVGVGILLKYALGALMPFLIGGLVACLLSPLSARLSAVTRLPRRLCAFFTVCLALLLFSALLSVILVRFLREAQTLLAGFGGEGGVEALWQGLLSRLPQALRRYLSEEQTQLLFEKAASAVTGFLTSAVGRILGGAPGAVLGALVTLLSVFYLTVDGHTILEQVGALMPKGVREATGGLRARAKGMAGRYIRALCLLFLLTFCEVFVGLVILRRRYALLCALLVALVDLLPVLGSGAVLIPWALLSFAGGESGVGAGLLILCGTVTVIRQIAEPRLVGESLGLHPFFSLFCMVLGMKLLGFAGMILLPIVASLLQNGFTTQHSK